MHNEFSWKLTYWGLGPSSLNYNQRKIQCSQQTFRWISFGSAMLEPVLEEFVQSTPWTRPPNTLFLVWVPELVFCKVLDVVFAAHCFELAVVEAMAQDFESSGPPCWQAARLKVESKSDFVSVMSFLRSFLCLVPWVVVYIWFCVYFDRISRVLIDTVLILR